MTVILVHERPCFSRQKWNVKEDPKLLLLDFIFLGGLFKAGTVLLSFKRGRDVKGQHLNSGHLSHMYTARAVQSNIGLTYAVNNLG